MTDKLQYESEALHSIHEKANTAKNECFFVGFLDGIIANDRIDSTEIEPLLAECKAICQQVGDVDAAEIIEESSAGHHDTPKELLDLLTQIAEVRSENTDPDCRRSSANSLLGFCAGVNCDSIITTREAKVLFERLNSSHDLDDDPRIAALRNVLLDALEDGKIEPPEADEISNLITMLVGDSYADTGIPSSESVPVVQDMDEIDDSTLDGSCIVLTGGFSFGTRHQVTERLQEHGAAIQRSPTRKTDIVIIGTEGSPHYTFKHHGGKLGRALELRSSGQAPRIYLESQLREYFR